MKIIATSASFALAIMFGGLADAAVAAPAHSTVIVAHSDDGDHGHSDSDLDNDDPVTNKGPNKVTPRINDDEQTAGGPSSAH